MGRRSINTTKSGKFMNPTDQARKEARKRELKKNKKQRMIVRHAVLKGKDPSKLVEEMEILDKLEYDTAAPPKLNEKVVKDKRKKLKEMFDRVIKMYEKEDLEYATELRKMEKECEKNRLQLQIRYEQVRNAERVQLDQIPLPDMPSLPDAPMPMPLPGDIPLPQLADKHITGILKKTSAYEKSVSMVPPAPAVTTRCRRKPPGPPPGPPPELSDSEDEEYDPEKDILENFGPMDVDVEHPLDTDDSEEDVDDEDIADRLENRQSERRIRFADDDTRDPDEPEKDSRPRLRPAVSSLQAKMLQLAGQKVPMITDMPEKQDDYPRRRHDDDDHEEKSRRRARKSERQGREADEKEKEKERTDLRDEVNKDGTETDDTTSTTQTTSVGPPGMPPGPPPGLPPGLPTVMPPGPPPGLPPMLMRPPPLRAVPLGGPPRMLPPGPPPGRPPGIPPGPPPGLPPNLRAPPMRMQLGPPGFAAGRMLRPPGIAPPINPSVLSAPPSLLRSKPDTVTPPMAAEMNRGSATIEAKPQIKSVTGDATRFMPTALRVKRDVRDSRGRLLKSAGKADEMPSMKIPSVQAPTKDDAYDSFMQEMEGLL